MLSLIQRKAAGHFRTPTDVTTMSPNTIYWFYSDYEEHIDMLALGPEITVCVCLYDGYLTVVEGVTIS